MRFTIVIITALFLSACNKNVNKEYYESGQLKSITMPTNRPDVFHYKDFYINGQTKSEGYIDETGLHIEDWKEYFCDGVLKWEGRFDSGQVVISNSKDWPRFVELPCKIEIKGNPKVLKLNKEYELRCVVDGLHPSIYHLTDENYIQLSKNEKDFECYPYVFRPQLTGKRQIWVIFPDSNGVFKVGDERLAFDFEIVE